MGDKTKEMNVFAHTDSQLHSKQIFTHYLNIETKMS